MSRFQGRSAPRGPARRRIPLVLIAVTLCAAATAAAQWTSTGPDGGTVTALASSPANPAILYAGTSAGLFVSRDAGASWTFSNALSPGVTSIAVDNSGQTVYAVAGRRIYVTSDGGVTWSHKTLVSFPLVVAIDPASPAAAYVGTVEGLVYRRTDGATAWAGGGLASPRATSIAVAPGTSTTAYLAGDTGVFKTADGGETWSLLSSLDAALGPKSSNQYFVAIDPAQPETVYAARSSETGSHLCASSNGGSSWGCGGNLFASVTALAFDHRGQTTIYAATADAGLFRSVDRGKNWHRSDDGLPGTLFALAATSDGAALFAGTSAGAYRSTDQADHWSSSGAGIHATTVTSLASAPTGPTTLFTGTNGTGLFRKDGTGEWKGLDVADPAVFGPVTAISVSPADPAKAYAGGSTGILTTEDRFDHGQVSGLSFPVSSLVIDPVAPTNIYAGQASSFGGSGGVFKSTDAGSTWTPTTLARAVYSLIIDSLHHSELYAGSDFDFGYYTTGGGIFKSTDAGATWTKGTRNFGFPVIALAMDPRSHSTIYAGTLGSGVWKSTDGAATWRAAGLSSLRRVAALVVDPIVVGRVYAATDSGVYLSTDGGRTWGPLGAGLPKLDVNSLAMEPDGSILHAGTAGGGVFDFAMNLGPCAAGALCLLGNRFEISLSATDPRREETSAGTAVGQTDRFGYFSLPEFTGDQNLPEVVVKMIDASATSFHSFWVFYSGLTNLPYAITVRDTLTGQLRIHESDGYCGGADTKSFQADAAADAAPLAEESRAEHSAAPTQLSLLGDRFLITLSATDPGRNRTSEGVAIQQNDRFGYFSLPVFTGDGALPEIFVKMVDGRPLPGHSFWFFYTGLTSLHYTLTVTDTVTGSIQTYGNDQGGSGVFCGGADTKTFHQSQ